MLQANAGASEMAEGGPLLGQPGAGNAQDPASPRRAQAHARAVLCIALTATAAAAVVIITGISTARPPPPPPPPPPQPPGKCIPGGVGGANGLPQHPHVANLAGTARASAGAGTGKCSPYSPEWDADCGACCDRDRASSCSAVGRDPGRWDSRRHLPLFRTERELANNTAWRSYLRRVYRNTSLSYPYDTQRHLVFYLQSMPPGVRAAALAQAGHPRRGGQQPNRAGDARFQLERADEPAAPGVGQADRADQPGPQLQPADRGEANAMHAECTPRAHPAAWPDVCPFATLPPPPEPSRPEACAPGDPDR